MIVLVLTRPRMVSKSSTNLAGTRELHRCRCWKERRSRSSGIRFFLNAFSGGLCFLLRSASLDAVSFSFLVTSSSTTLVMTRFSRAWNIAPRIHRRQCLRWLISLNQVLADEERQKFVERKAGLELEGGLNSKVVVVQTIQCIADNVNVGN